MDIGTLLLMLGLAYGTGVLWYDLLPGKLPARPWRVAAYPFVGMYCAEALVGGKLADFTFGGLHLIAIVVGSLAAVVVDWVITQARHPTVVAQFEPRSEPRAA